MRGESEEYLVYVILLAVCAMNPHKAHYDSDNVHRSLRKWPTIVVIKIIRSKVRSHNLIRHLAVILLIRSQQVLHHWRLISKTVRSLPPGPHLFVAALRPLERIELTVASR